MPGSVAPTPDNEAVSFHDRAQVADQHFDCKGRLPIATPTAMGMPTETPPQYVGVGGGPGMRNAGRVHDCQRWSSELRKCRVSVSVL